MSFSSELVDVKLHVAIESGRSVEEREAVIVGSEDPETRMKKGRTVGARAP